MTMTCRSYPAAGVAPSGSGIVVTRCAGSGGRALNSVVPVANTSEKESVTSENQPSTWVTGTRGVLASA